MGLTLALAQAPLLVLFPPAASDCSGAATAAPVPAASRRRHFLRGHQSSTLGSKGGVSLPSAHARGLSRRFGHSDCHYFLGMGP